MCLKRILKATLEVHIDKFFWDSDWRMRPLSEGMLDYARSDSHYLIPCYLVLMCMMTPGEFGCVPQDLKEPNLQKIKDPEIFTKIQEKLTQSLNTFSVQKMFLKNNHKRLEIFCENY